ncbi:MAG: HAMP domain-containing protein [Dehalococcoidia bacterium]|nr:HAMP domain-containing protein [Dehalococcoidia bacterium]
MLPRGVSARFAVTFGALFVVILGLLVALVVYVASGWLESALDDHLVSVARDAEARMEDPDVDRGFLVERLSSPTQIIELRDADGTVLARSSLLDEQTLPVSRASMAREQRTFITAPYEGGRLRVLVHPLLVDGEVTGYVNVATPLPGLARQVRQLVLIILLIGTIALGLSLVATWLVAGWLTRPLRELAAAVRRNATAEVPEEITVRPPGSAEVMAVAHAVRELTEEQRLRLERERSFFADSSHVLRTPLAVLQGNLELMEHAQDDAERRDAVRQAQSALQSVNRTVRGLLLLSRERPGVADWRLVDLSALAASVAAEFRRAWPDHNLTCDIEPGIEVAVDEHELREALEAVLENAGRYTPAGGAVDLRCYSEQDHAVIDVRDNGIGLSEDEARRATDRFFRGFEARALQPGGSGLGLAIARRILAMHGGRLSIAPREDVTGAHLTIVLPLLAGPAD